MFKNRVFAINATVSMLYFFLRNGP